MIIAETSEVRRMHPDLELLLQLQSVDYEIGELERSKDYMPDMMQTLREEMEKTETTHREAVEELALLTAREKTAELDSVTPAEGVIDMFERTKEPKKLWVIRGAAHYDVYREDLLNLIMEMSTGWLKAHLPRE